MRMIEREERNGIVILRLAHGKASTLDLELLQNLSRVADELSASDARAVVLTGTGSIFSAGVDLFRLVDGGNDYVHAFLPALDETFRKLFTLEKPLVVAANGHAIAGGCILVECGDYRLMSTGNGRIGVPELLVGVPFPTLALEILRFALPRERTQEIVLTGKTYTADEALAKGLVDELTEPGALLDRAVAMAEHLGTISRESFKLAKKELRQITLERVNHFGGAFESKIREVWTNPATHEGIRAYLAKTVRK